VGLRLGPGFSKAWSASGGAPREHLQAPPGAVVGCSRMGQARPIATFSSCPRNIHGKTFLRKSSERRSGWNPWSDRLCKSCDSRFVHNTRDFSRFERRLAVFQELRTGFPSIRGLRHPRVGPTPGRSPVVRGGDWGSSGLGPTGSGRLGLSSSPDASDSRTAVDRSPNRGSGPRP